MLRHINSRTYFFFLIGISIVSTYYMPSVVAYIWYVAILIIYYYSKNEAFWLAFFFVLSDGFMGFFGFYETTIPVFPGMPEIELAQYYFLIAFIKVYYKKNYYTVYFMKQLMYLFLFTVFLIIWISSTTFAFNINAT